MTFKVGFFFLWLLSLIFSSGITFQSMSQEGQGQVRCTNGQLVSSAPAGPNTVAYYSLREPAKPSSFPQTNGKEREAVAISTEKPAYEMGEIVNIPVENTGTDPLTFPNSILGLGIENAVTNKKYPLFAAQVITTLDSGET